MKSKITFLLPLIVFTFLSCDEELECLFGLKPEINTKTISSAIVNQEYFDRITAEVDNAVNDDSFDYFFTITGDIPEGIDVIFFPRSIEFRGAPEETGSFDFTVFLAVEKIEDGRLDSSPTCVDSVSTDFTLFVADQ